MRLAIGTGTGRCGTKSLRVLCMAQPQCCVTHERLRLPWAGGEAVLPEALALWRDAAAQTDRPFEAVWEAHVEVRGAWSEGEKIVGDIGPWYLPLVPILVEQHGARVVHLERDRDGYVASALRCSWDCFSARPARGEDPGPEFLTSVPKFLAPREQAAGMWWDMVHELALEWAREYPEGFRVWQTTDLNSRARQADMMRWIGVADPVTLDRYPERAENRLAKVGP